MTFSILDAMSPSTAAEVTSLTISAVSNRRAFLALYAADGSNGNGRTSVTADGTTVNLTGTGLSLDHTITIEKADGSFGVVQ